MAGERMPEQKKLTSFRESPDLIDAKVAADLADLSIHHFETLYKRILEVQPDGDEIASELRIIERIVNHDLQPIRLADPVEAAQVAWERLNTLMLKLEARGYGD